MSKLEVAFAFEIDGKEIDPREVTDPEIKTKIEKIVESVSGKVGGLRCPHHDEAARFVCFGPNFDDLSMEVYGCCDALVNIVKGGLSE